ncbi:MAG: TPM domain-containing protein, partial [Pollutimonas bauzanensis]
MNSAMAGFFRSLGLAFLLSLAAAPIAGAAQATVPVPELKSRVTDTTGTLDSNTQSHLSQVLADLEKRKGAQIAVLVVATTGEDTIESYARRAFDQWRLGRKKVDDGILFVVAKDDRHLRIEVGYGLEGAVPDLLAGRIIREQVTPRFKQGDYAAGITAGVESLAKLVDGEPLPPPAAGGQADT